MCLSGPSMQFFHFPTCLRVSVAESNDVVEDKTVNTNNATNSTHSYTFSVFFEILFIT